MLEIPALTRKPYPVSHESLCSTFEVLVLSARVPVNLGMENRAISNSSTYGGTAQDCHGRYDLVPFLIYIRRLNDGLPRGPGFRISDFESNRIIAQLQADGARSLMSGQLAPVTGAVRSVHTYLDMYVNYLSTFNRTIFNLLTTEL
jgi:hypothetical protein